MSNIKSTKKALEASAKAKVDKHLAKIKAGIVAEARRKGHNGISEKHVKKVSFNKIKDLEFAIDMKIQDFIFTEKKALVHLDGMTWHNNSGGDGNRELRVKKTTDDEYTWKITSGFTAKTETSAKVSIDIPSAGSAEVTQTWSFAFDFHLETGIARKVSREWENTFHQDIPKYTSVRMEVRGVQFKGYAPFTLISKASGKIHCSYQIDYWGKHNGTFDINLDRLLNEKERTFVSDGRIDGIEGYEWDIYSSIPEELDEIQRKSLPRGISEHPYTPISCQIPELVI